MPEDFATVQSLMQEVYRFPGITAYNRLEPSLRTKNFDRSVSAEVRDPLWMLSRQWQFGEFQGEDAGSPINATLLAKHSMVDRMKMGSDPVKPYSDKVPLEATVEQESQVPNLMVRNQAGRYFIKLLRVESLEAVASPFVTQYPLETNSNWDAQELQFFELVRNNIPDGYRIAMAVGDGRYATFLEGNPNKVLLNEIGSKLHSWWSRMYTQPKAATSPAWIPKQLEYQFSLADGEGDGRNKLTADQYFQGHLDWYVFNAKGDSDLTLESGTNKPITQKINTFIPTPITFKGMPHPRYWQMEEQTVNFGKIDSSPTGLLHLLFAEFGLVYANDWFMLPYPMKVNSLTSIKGIRVTDVFGQYTLVKPAGTDWNSNWQSWGMYQLSGDRAEEDRNLFYLPPSLYKSLENEPLEKVNFVRDEMTNLVWAIEERVPSAYYKGRMGKEIALEEAAKETLPPIPPSENVKYTLGTSTPSNRTPFIPVHMPGSESEIRLQRAKMVDGKSPKGVLLTEVASPYFINEEEIVRSGISVTRALQRTRWLNGTTYLWTGRQKKNGTKETWSGSQFDQIDESE